LTYNDASLSDEIGEPIMPKQKTHKASKKRFRLTATGKVKHRQAGTSHLLSRMETKRKRKLRGTDVLDSVEAKRIRTLLGRYSY
jgi:large subunit ribosomal protein L35